MKMWKEFKQFKRGTKLALVSLLLMLFVLPVVIAQQTGGTLTGQQAQHYDATLYYATNATSATTLTINGQANNYIYFNLIDIENCAGVAVTGAAPTTITTTGIGSGVTPIFMVGSGSTAGTCQPNYGYYGGIPLKSNSPGTNATFVLPTFATNQTVRLNVWYYYAP